MKLWEGYLIRHIGVFVHPVVVWSGLILSFLGTVGIIYHSLITFYSGNASAKKLEKAATHESFQAIGKVVTKIGSRAELEELPKLYYTR